MTLWALYTDNAYVDLTIGHEVTLPTISRPGSVQYTPYGPAWVESTGLRAGEGRLLLSVGGTTPTLASDNTNVWLSRALTATRLQFKPTGSFMQILQVREGKPDLLRGGVRWTWDLALDFADPFWHYAVGDGSTRPTP